MCKKLKKIDYGADQNDPRWLELRRTLGWGGSEIKTLLGANPWQSKYALFVEKSGKVPHEDISDKEAIRLGNDLEQYVAERWMEACGKKCHKVNYILVDPEMPFAMANIDRKVAGEDAGLECKTTSNYEILDQCKRGFPEAYYYQCVHYLMVTGYDRWYLAVLVFGRGFYHFCLERSEVEAEIAALEKIEAEEWQNLQNGEMPEVDGSDSTTAILNGMWTSNSETCVDLTPLENTLLIREKLIAQRDELDEQISACENAVREYMGESEKGKIGKYTVSYKTGTRSSFDSKAFDKEYPDMRIPFMKQSVSRTLRITTKKEK